MEIVIYISFLCYALGGVIGTTRQMQMLQQNSYFPSRYFKWIKESWDLKRTLYIVFALIIWFLISLNHFLFIAVSFIYLAVKTLNAGKCQKKSIKPLHFTARIKRLYTTESLIVLALAVGSVFVEPILQVLLVLCFCPPLLLMVARTINAPMEKTLGLLYINDAKRKLKSHNNLTVIGITGSYGKTSTKYILAELLQRKYNVLFTPASFNTPFGVVRTIREGLRPETGIFIAEMGAKNIGDIKEICDIANPDYGIITSVGPQHLETFKSIKNVTKTKFELADAVIKNGGKIFLNSDNQYIVEKAKELPHISFGKQGDTCYKNVTYTENGAEFDIVKGETEIHIKTKLLGMHNVVNITAAAALALELGVKPTDIAFAASRLKPVSHRLEMKSFINGSVLLDDAYNANPSGSIEAVNVLGGFKGRHKVIVTPGLIELGDKEYECNYNLGAAAAKTCDTIILVGKKRSVPMKNAADDLKFNGTVLVVSSFREAMEYLTANAKKDWVVLFENDLPDNYTK